MSSLLENLNTEQLQAVAHLKGPLLIVAGAGTGKTTVISRRIAHLVQQNLARPEEILALTFTEKAAGEMEDRTLQLLPIGNYDTWISTFHSFCERILKQHALDIGLPNNFKLVDDTRAWVMTYNNFEAFKLDYYKPVATPHKFIDALLTHFSKCKDERISPSDYLAYAEELKLSGDSPELLPSDDRTTEIKRCIELANAYHTYQKLLLENESLDFGDLINYTCELFKKRPNILAYYQSKFKYILVDEFQDTNLAQYELVRLLTGNSEQNLTVVGDDDQSIYKFRGASVSNILNFKKDFPHLTQITLTHNYRSAQAILDLAYNFIQHNNPDRLEVELGISKKLIGHNTTPPEITVIEGDDLATELNTVIKKIASIKSENQALTWNDFAILIRSNAAADEIISRLETAGIPYTFLANVGLYKKPLIATLIGYLQLLNNYHDSTALLRTLTLPQFRLPAEQLATLTLYAHKKTLSLYEAMQSEELQQNLSEASRVIIQALLALLDKHSQASYERTTAELFAYIIKDLQIPDLLNEDTLENAQNRELLDQFYKIIEGFEQETSQTDLRSFLQELDLQKRAGNEGIIKFDPDSGPESLKVLTVHASKGLEFENVFIVNMVDQRFPTRAKRDGIEIPPALIKDILPEGDFHLEEERRLFYVAMTRAKSKLFFSWGKDYGGARAKKPSVFLTEAGLLPSTTVSKATGKVVFTNQKTDSGKQVFKELPKQFSFTDLSTFERCPLEYKYKCYLKLPLPGAAQLSFGITIHNVLQQYLEQYQTQLAHAQIDLFGATTKPDYPPFDTLTTLYSQQWIDEWYTNKSQKQEYFDRGIKMLEIFYRQTLEDKPTPKYIEQFFKLKLGEYDFVGKIDRADAAGEGIAILDYKTGKTPKKHGDGDIDQLRIYQVAAEEYLKEKVTSLTYWYLQDNERKSEPVATPAELETCKAKIITTIENIIEAIRYNRFAKLHTEVGQHICQFADLEPT